VSVSCALACAVTLGARYSPLYLRRILSGSTCVEFLPRNPRARVCSHAAHSRFINLSWIVSENVCVKFGTISAFWKKTHACGYLARSQVQSLFASAAPYVLPSNISNHDAKNGLNRLRNATPMREHTDTQTHKHTDTQTHRHTDTQTHRHTDTQTHTRFPL
jgi:hypothetical protein